MLNGDAGYGMYAYKRVAVLLVVIVRTFHQRALWIGISHSHVYADWSVKVAEDGFGCRVVFIHVVSWFYSWCVYILLWIYIIMCVWYVHVCGIGMRV